MARIYLETTIFSFYFEVRSEPDMVARRDWTRRWLDNVDCSGNELVTSLAVVGELDRGEFPGKAEALQLLERYPVEDISEPVIEIVEAYIARMVMPNDPTGDALHLALASYHQCDFLATWNCKHLANANKFDHIRRVNGILGLTVPSLVTPLELLGENPSDEK
ncbi:type II toxin-antitoxin system VapC family toxin [Planctomicrobium sp.]|jgi:predicted nucleic acid-binding protein|nr:type II toxin-antitoxin system VapC family toxin [Planctomicrobium sp.]MDB4744014.1 type II toxin-antitoxin system VapC family toxin [Planctomicrobium sp.]